MEEITYSEYWGEFSNQGKRRRLLRKTNIPGYPVILSGMVYVETLLNRSKAISQNNFQSYKIRQFASCIVSEFKNYSEAGYIFVEDIADIIIMGEYLSNIGTTEDIEEYMNEFDALCNLLKTAHYNTELLMQLCLRQERPM